MIFHFISIYLTHIRAIRPIRVHINLKQDPTVVSVVHVVFVVLNTSSGKAHRAIRVDLPYSCSIKNKYFVFSHSPQVFLRVLSVQSVCDILQLRFISVYRLTIFLWCQPQLLQFNQTVESSHYRKGCLNSSNTK